MAAMTPEVQWEVICLNMQKARWDEAGSLDEAFADMRLAWQQGEDPSLLVLASTNFGQVSAYSGRVMSTVAEAIAHEKTHVLALENQVAQYAAPEPDEADKMDADLDKADAGNAWREAVAARKTAMADAKKQLTAQIKLLRDGYAALEKQWDDYVAATREAAKTK